MKSTASEPGLINVWGCNTTLDLQVKTTYSWGGLSGRSLFHLSCSLAFIFSCTFLLRTAPHVDSSCISFCRSSAKRQVKTSQDDAKLCQLQLSVNKSQILYKFSLQSSSLARLLIIALRLSLLCLSRRSSFTSE